MKRSRHVIPGLAAQQVGKSLAKASKVENKTYNKDTQNRRYIIQKVNEFMQEGNSLEEAIDMIMKDDIIKEFDYWTKNNLDVRQCIMNLVRTHSNGRNAKGKER